MNAGLNDDAAERMSLCGVLPTLSWLSGGSNGLTETDGRSIWFCLKITSATRLDYVHATCYQSYLNNGEISSNIGSTRKIFRIEGLLRA